MRIAASKSGLLDLLSGTLGLVILLVLDFGTRIKFDLRWFFIVGAAFCVAVGFFRGGGQSGNPRIKALLMCVGFSGPILVLSVAGMTFGGVGILVVFVLVASISISCGVFARQAWRGRRGIATAALVLVPVGAVALVSMVWLPQVMGRLSAQHVNQPAAEFSLTTDDGKVIASTDLRGKIVVLAFWATWCEPCWQELPKVEKVYASYKDNPSVVFWAVNARAGGDTDSTARAFAKKMRLGIPVAYTENESAGKLGVDGYPTLVVLDGRGHLRFIHSGYDGSEHLESDLAREIANLIGQEG